MNATDQTYDVVVVGLGPTGLTLAHLLGRRGLSVPRPQSMCSTSSGMPTQACLRASYTDTFGAGNVGSPKAPSAIAIASGARSSR